MKSSLLPAALVPFTFAACDQMKDHKAGKVSRDNIPPAFGKSVKDKSVMQRLKPLRRKLLRRQIKMLDQIKPSNGGNKQALKKAVLRDGIFLPCGHQLYA